VTTTEKIHAWDFVVELSKEAGESVEILCENPKGSPNAAVRCYGEWTDWEHERFEATSIIEALARAVLVMHERLAEDSIVEKISNGSVCEQAIPPSNELASMEAGWESCGLEVAQEYRWHMAGGGLSSWSSWYPIVLREYPSAKIEYQYRRRKA